MIETADRPREIPVFASIAIVLLCLGAGGWFILWYFKGGKPATFTLPDGAGTFASARVATAGGAPGNNSARRRRGPGQQPPQPPQQDGVATWNEHTFVRAGPVFLRILPPRQPGGSPVLIFGKRWGPPPNPPEFTIARRIVGEDALASRLAVTPDQLRRLKAIVAKPVLHPTYNATIPADAAAVGKLQKLWAAYQGAPGGASKNAAEQELVATVRSTGEAGIASLQKEFKDESGAIRKVLTPQQVQLYADLPNRPTTLPASRPTTKPLLMK